MFRFTMNSREASIYTRKALRKMGIMEDENFALNKWREFFRKYPNFDPENPDSEGYKDALRTYNEIFFRMDSHEPENLYEAIAIVREIFFFSPARVWLQGQEIKINNQINFF